MFWHGMPHSTERKGLWTSDICSAPRFLPVSPPSMSVCKMSTSEDCVSVGIVDNGLLALDNKSLTLRFLVDDDSDSLLLNFPAGCSCPLRRCDMNDSTYMQSG